MQFDGIYKDFKFAGNLPKRRLHPQKINFDGGNLRFEEREKFVFFFLRSYQVNTKDTHGLKTSC